MFLLEILLPRKQKFADTCTSQSTPRRFC